MNVFLNCFFIYTTKTQRALSNTRSSSIPLVNFSVLSDLVVDPNNIIFK